MTETEFTASIEKHRKALLGYARSYVNDRDRAEDPVQEACLDLLPKYSAFIPKRPEAEKYWYRKFVRFCIFRLWRKEARHKYPLHTRTKVLRNFSDGEEEDPLSPEIIDPNTFLDPVFHERYRLYELVRKSMNKMPSDIQISIWGRLVLEQTWEEIGQQLGLKTNAVESFLRPYIKQLREDLHEWKN